MFTSSSFGYFTSFAFCCKARPGAVGTGAASGHWGCVAGESPESPFTVRPAAPRPPQSDRLGKSDRQMAGPGLEAWKVGLCHSEPGESLAARGRRGARRRSRHLTSLGLLAIDPWAYGSHSSDSHKCGQLNFLVGLKFFFAAGRTAGGRSRKLMPHQAPEPCFRLETGK